MLLAVFVVDESDWFGFAILELRLLIVPAAGTLIFALHDGHLTALFANASLTLALKSQLWQLILIGIANGVSEFGACV